MKILTAAYTEGTAYSWVAFYHPVVSLTQSSILTLAKKPPMELIPAYVYQIYTDEIFIDPEHEHVPQMSRVKRLYYGSILLVSRVACMQNIVDSNIIHHGFRVISKLLHTGSDIADNWRNKIKGDLKDSVDKKGGSTKQNVSGLTASSTRVSTKRLSTQLASYGLCIKDVVGDGNCLFRSLSDQMIGESDNHLIYRNQVTDYIFSHSDEFKPFYSETDNFQKSIMTLSKFGAFAGNEALVAFARIYSVDIVIHQLNQSPWRIKADCNRKDDVNSTELSSQHRHCQSMLLINDAKDDQDTKELNRSLSHKDLTKVAKQKEERRELHICYHSYPHYSSVRRIGDGRGRTPTHIKLNELIVKYPVASKTKRGKSDKNKTKIPKLIKLSNVMSSPSNAEAESDSAVTRRIFAAVDI